MRLLNRPAPAEPAVSESERRLFGGPLRYDAGWANHDYARLESRLLTTLRSMPRMAGGTLRLAWQTDRRALLTVAVTEAGQGITSAVGLLVLSVVLRSLLGAGSAAERLHAALPSSPRARWSPYWAPYLPPGRRRPPGGWSRRWSGPRTSST